MMGTAGNIESVDLKRSIYRGYSRCHDDPRHFAGGKALALRIEWAMEGFGPGRRLLDQCCGSEEILSNAVERTGVEGHSRSKGSSFSQRCAKTNYKQ